MKFEITYNGDGENIKQMPLTKDFPSLEVAEEWCRKNSVGGKFTITEKPTPPRKKTICLTVGAPGSGKSTWAENEAKHKGVIVVNRDDLRTMLKGGGTYKYSREMETKVTQIVKATIESFLDDQSSSMLIIADTNLNESTRNGYEKIFNHWKSFGGQKRTNVGEFIEKPFDVPWVELVKRNQKRGDKSVPIDVLRDFYLKMQKYMQKHKQYVGDPQKEKAVIFDLDGTLANNNHRGAFEYDKLIDDKPIRFVMDIAHMYKNAGYKIICVSGRNAGESGDVEKFHKLTNDWLVKHGLSPDLLILRKWDDYRSDDIIKEEIFWKHIAPKYNVVSAFDDRNRVVDMWRRIGVNCCQVDYGDF